MNYNRVLKATRFFNGFSRVFCVPLAGEHWIKQLLLGFQPAAFIVAMRWVLSALVPERTSNGSPLHWYSYSSTMLRQFSTRHLARQLSHTTHSASQPASQPVDMKLTHSAVFGSSIPHFSLLDHFRSMGCRMQPSFQPCMQNHIQCPLFLKFSP